MEVLNVTTIPGALKHSTIYSKFNALNAGESFVIQNDHDPKPLYYQLTSDYGDLVAWQYLANGPEVWEVEIGKQMLAEKTIGQMVAEDYRNAEVFKSYKIDFCCKGGRTLNEACEDKGIDPQAVQEDLAIVKMRPGAPAINFSEWDTPFLVDYIVNVHHSYVNQASKLLLEFGKKVAGVHGQEHPELIELYRTIQNLTQEMKDHMMKEEEILFPAIKKLSSGVPTKLNFQHPIMVMEAEHEAVGQMLEHIREITNDFEAPAGACNSFRFLYSKLQEFEKQTFEHVHLENNILFPKAQREQDATS